ncbi:MAG: tRNA epoxyqueuosine(34) reductase QueG, partial [Bacteroidetes bacterium]|nr:tRNA epoxyqueuosine(34) reductase QueG [Bacteroidota bacterium]
NRFSQAHNEPLFQPNAELLQYSKAQWAELTEEVFHEIFKKSAVQRAGYSGLIQTIKFLKD